MTARHLVVGLDGADWDLLEAIGRDRLPTLFALRDRGAYARMLSVLPFATLPNWTTFLTGMDPGTHGVFDFTMRDGYRVHFASGSARAVPTVLARLDALGLSCASLFFPGTYPPERLANGISISGWDSPVAFEADRSFCAPTSLFDELTARFGPMRFDEADEFGTDAEGFHDRLGGLLSAKVDRRAALLSHLLEQRSWDVFACYFGESDTASHHLHGLFDRGSPRRPANVGKDAEEGLPRVYEALDRALAQLLAAAGPDTEVTLVSDHGSGASSDKVVHLNRALEDAGLLAFRAPRFASRLGSGLTRTLKESALTRMPPRIKERAFSALGRALPGWLESRARFGAIDLTRTRVFSEELNYFPSLLVNLRGREPDGTVEPHELPKLRGELERFAEALRDPWTGARVITAIHAREDVYFGPLVSRAPDFILELAFDEGRSYNLMPSSGAAASGVFRRLGEDEWLGRKGRSLPGSHRPHGLFLAAGPSIARTGEIPARIADATATMLARIGVAPLDEMPGRVLREILVKSARPSLTLPSVAPTLGEVPDLARTEARLRALGYVD
jgi:predicted AlkP superfamily phosphohydrolase/phosphomutase